MPEVAHRDPATLRIVDGVELGQWHRVLRRTLWSRDLPVVTFHIDGLPAPHNLSLTARARELRGACGCASSGFLMTAAVVYLAVAWLTSDSPSTMPTLSRALAGVGWILLAGGVGKIAGIFWARWRLLQLASGLQAALAGHSLHSR